MADDARNLPNAAFLETSFLYGANTAYVEEMHARYLADPSSVDPSWRNFFQGLRDAPEDVRRGLEGPSWSQARNGRVSAVREEGEGAAAREREQPQIERVQAAQDS